MKRKHFAAFAGIAVGGLSAVFLLAAPQSDKTDAKSDSQTEQRETVAKPMTAKQKKKQEAKLRKELETPYKKWLNEDVGYIITDEERKAFKRLQHRRRARTIHRTILAAARSDARHRGKRVQGRALPAHRVRERTLRFGHSRLEDRPRPHVHCVWPA